MKQYLILSAAILLTACSTHESRYKPGRTQREEPPRENYPPRSQPLERNPKPTPVPPPQPAPTPVSSLHPNLIITETDIAQTRKLVHTDPTAEKWFAYLNRKAEQTLREPPPTKMPEGSLTHTSRTALGNISTLAGLYRINGDERFAKRAIDEMLACCAFENWMPDDFLATAEMTNAMAIGYDWLYPQMTPAQRKIVASAIVNKGLKFGLRDYSATDNWTTARHNWNLVGNGGMIVGALAVRDVAPQNSRDILSKARDSIKYGMSCYAPDGGWEEGPTYWNYATRYAVFAIAALQSADKTDWGLLRSPGFSQTGLFRAYTQGPSGKPFNFADAENEIGSSAQLEYLARVYKNPALAAFEVSTADPLGIFDLLYYRPVSPSALESLRHAMEFSGVGVFAMRSGDWDDANVTYVAGKAGSNRAHHGHLDQGTFVIDALGERWVTQLGADSYSLPHYFGEDRFNYYRCATRGQNTLVLDRKNQDEKSEGKIESFDANRKQVVLDLTGAYRPDARQVRRGISLVNRDAVLIQDEIDLDSPTPIQWAIHTAADVRAAGNSALMTINGKTMRVQILSPSNAKFEVQAPQLTREEEPAPGVKKLVINLPGSRGSTRLAVLFSPGGSSTGVKVQPLEKWDGMRAKEK